MNRRPADYERSYLDFSLAAPGFSGLSPRLSRENQQVNYPVSAFSSALKTTFCGQAMGQTMAVSKNLRRAEKSIKDYSGYRLNSARHKI